MLITTILQKIPLGVALLIFAAAFLRIWSVSKRFVRGELIGVLKKAKYISAGILAFSLLLTGIYAGITYVHNRNFAFAIITLNYSKASVAQNSNGTRYNMAEITCDEVLERAIEKGALPDVTAKELKACLTAYPYVQGDVDNKEEYHISTEYALEFFANSDTKHLDAGTVVQLVTLAYKEYYLEKYVDRFGDTLEEEPDWENLEYMDQVLYLKKEATSILTYLYGLGDAGPSFVTKDNMTFQSIAGKVYQFRDIQISQNLRSLILQSGLAKDTEGYVDRLAYQNTMTEFNRRKNAASFTLCNDAIKLYSPEMTRVVLVPTWDESGKYYMGRTKVGIDELSVLATSFSNKVAENEENMMGNDLIIQKMNQRVFTATAPEAVDALILQIREELDSFEKEAISAGREWMDHQMNQCIGVSIYGPSLMGFLRQVAVAFVLFYGVFLTRSLSHEIVEEKKKRGGKQA